MIHFHIPGMTCGGCARSIAAAVRGVDADAHIETDIPARRVGIDSGHERAAFVEAIREAGYDVLAS